MTTIDDWFRARNVAAESDIDGIDAQYAEALGLPTLSALLQFAQRIAEANEYIGRAEIMSELRPIIHVATGEARERLRLHHADDQLEIPGIPAIPHSLLERQR